MKIYSRYSPLMYLGLIALYGAVGFSSLGYDDEIFNIRAVEKYGLDVVSYVQGVDVHPPGSYFINWALFTMLGEWSLVRLVASVFSACCLIYAIESVRKGYGLTAGFLAFFLLGLNPAILLWCTGIRWYSFFVPIFLCLCITPKLINRWYWIKIFSGLLLLGYIGYAAFVLAPALLALYWTNYPSDNREKIKSISLYGSIAALAYAHQLRIFITVHLANKESQVFSLWKGLIGFAVAQVSNQGVFPVSIGGFTSAIGSLGLLSLGIWYSIKQRRVNEFFLPYWIVVVGLIVSGLAGKFRNFVTLSPLQALWFATLDVDSGKKKLFAIFFAFAAIGNCFGIFNVASHQDTTKNSWNLPRREALVKLDTTRSACANDLLVLTPFDPVLTYLLEKQGYTTLNPLAGLSENESSLDRDYRCVVALKTYNPHKDDEIMRIYRWS